MSQVVTCSGASLAAGEPLPGTATQGVSWLLVEVRGSWGSDAVLDTTMSAAVRAALEAFSGKVVLMRRPDRRHGATLVRATVDEEGGPFPGRSWTHSTGFSTPISEAGEPAEGPIFSSAPTAGVTRAAPASAYPSTTRWRSTSPERLWQSSHLGGHRFAPNLSSCRRDPARPDSRRAGPGVAGLLDDGRIPLDLYRGRTAYAPPVQAAELFVRSDSAVTGSPTCGWWRTRTIW